METETFKLVTELGNITSKREMMDFISIKHLEQKTKLLEEDVEFYDDIRFENEIIGNQSFSGRYLITKIRYYEELNYILCGINGKWVTHIDDLERFAEIKKVINEILKKCKS